MDAVKALMDERLVEGHNRIKCIKHLKHGDVENAIVCAARGGVRRADLEAVFSLLAG